MAEAAPALAPERQPAPRPTAPLLSVDSLTKAFPNGTVALNQVSLAARPGELTVILGHNGSGKSTLVRCIVRLLEPTSGSVFVRGRELTRLRGRELRLARRDIGVVFQRPSLIPRRSTVANVAAGCLGRQQGLLSELGGFPKAELEAASIQLAKVGLSSFARQRADSLSGGQAQRAAIARALHQAPSVLLADEPVASLDPEAAADVMELLRELARREWIAVVCVLHQLDLAQRFADRVIGLRQGRVVLDGAVQELGLDQLARLYKDAEGRG